MTTDDNTPTAPSKPSVFERTDTITGHDEHRIRANFDADLWDTYEAAFRREVIPGTGGVDAQGVERPPLTAPARGTQRALIELHRMLVFLDLIAEGHQPIPAKSAVQAMGAAEVLERYAPEPDEPDPENPVTEVGKGDTDDASTPPTSPEAASPPE